MSGTNWVDYQQGSTRQELAEALSLALDTRQITRKADRNRSAGLLNLYLQPENISAAGEKTGLRLTGEPLVPYDVERIAEAWRLK